MNRSPPVLASNTTVHLQDNAGNSVGAIPRWIGQQGSPLTLKAFQCEDALQHFELTYNQQPLPLLHFHHHEHRLRC